MGVRGTGVIFPILLALTPAPTSAETVLPPGTDLAQALAEEPFEELFILKAGEYPGFLNISGRKVELTGDAAGGTILTGGKPPIIAQVVERGELITRHIGFKIRANGGTAILVKQGRARISGCHASASDKMTFYVDNGALSLEDCVLKGLRGIGVLGYANARITITGSRFDGSSQKATPLLLQNRSSATVKNSQFQNLASGAIFATGNSKLVVRDSEFKKIAGNAVTAAKNSIMHVSKSRFTEIAKLALFGVEGATLTADTVDIRKTGGAAVQSQDGGQLTVFDSTMNNVGEGVVAYRGHIAAVISGNQISGVVKDRAAITIEADGRLEISDNKLEGSGIFVGGKFDDKPLIEGNQIWRAKKNGVYGEAVPGLILRNNRIVAAAKSGLLVSKTPLVELSGNWILSPGEFAVFVQHGSSLRMAGNILFAAKQALHIHGTAAAGNQSGGDIFIAPIGGRSRLTVDAAGGKLARELENKPLLAALRKSALQVIQAPVKGRAAALAALSAAADQLRQRARRLATIQLSAVDLAGNRFPPPATAFSMGGLTTRYRARGGILILPPGGYQLRSPLLPEPVRVTLKADQLHKMTLNSHEYLKLTFRVTRVKDKWTERDYLLRLKPKSGRRAGLNGYRHGMSHDQRSLRALYSLRRAGVQAADTAATRALAIKALRAATEQVARLNPELAALKRDEAKNKDAIAGKNKRANEANGRARLAIILLSVFGQAADTELILAYGDLRQKRERQAHVIAAAWLENRFGRLNTGQVAARLQAPALPVRLRAALALDFLGSAIGTATLIGYLKEQPAEGWDPEFMNRAMLALLGRDDPAVLAIARRSLALHLRQLKEPKFRDLRLNFLNPAVVHLLAFGNADDMRDIASARLSPDMAEPLAPLLREPAVLGRIQADRMLTIIKRNWSFFHLDEMRNMAALCPALRALPSAAREPALNQLRRQWIRVHSKQNGPRNAALFGAWYLNMAMSNCIADSQAAQAMIEAHRVDTWPYDWMPDRKKQRHWEFEPWDVVEPKLKAAWPKDAEAVALRTAKWKFTENAPRVADSLPDGVTRLATVLWRGAPPTGALSVVAGVRPEWLDGKLRLGLGFDLASYRGGSLADAIANDPRRFSDFTSTEGKALIAAVSLDRDGKEIALENIGIDGRGEFVYQADLAERDLAGLHLNVQLDMFGTKKVLSFPIFASELARRMLRPPAAGDPETPLAAAFRKTGRGDYSDAVALFREAFAKTPGAINLRLGVARLYSDRALYKAAQSLLEPGFAETPDDTRLLFALASARMHAGDFSAAQAAYQRLAELRSGRDGWAWRAAAAALLAGHHTAAHEAYVKSKGTVQEIDSLMLRFYSARLAGIDEGATVPQRIKTLLAAQKASKRKATAHLVYLEHLFASGKPGAMPRSLENSFISCRRLLAYALRWAGPEHGKTAAKAARAAAGVCPPGSTYYHLTRLPVAP